MTINSTVNRFEFTGDGVTVAFTYGSQFTADEDLKVFTKLIASPFTETLKILTTDYTVSGAGDGAGGTVTFLVAPPNTVEVILYGDPDATQLVNLRENNATSEETREGALDKLTLLVQAALDRFNRAVRLSDAFKNTFDTRLPADLAAGKTIAVNAAGDGLENGPDATDVANAAANSVNAAADADRAEAAADSISNTSINPENFGLAASVAANALTWNLKQKNGTSDPTASDTVHFKIRNTTLGDGAPIDLIYNSATSLVVPSGATLGSKDAQEQRLYLYALYDGTNKELAISARDDFDDGRLHSTTALDGASDKEDTLYSTTARANAVCKLIGSLNHTQATAGTWLTVPANLNAVQDLPRSPVQSLIMMPDMGTVNVGLDLTAGKLSMVQANGNPFSADNPGYIVLPHTDLDGKKVMLKVNDTTHFFEDKNGASDIIGEFFNETTGVVWDEDRPFFIYALNRDNTDAGLLFFISENPTINRHIDLNNGVAFHGTPATAVHIDFQTTFFLTSTNIVNLVQNKPCMLIGGIRMQKDIADDWTVQALEYERGDGIRKDPFIRRTFLMPVGQKTAAAGQWIHEPSGAAPAVDVPNSNYQYYIGLDGFVTILIYLKIDAVGVGGPATTGIVTPYLLDYLSQDGENSYPFQMKHGGSNQHGSAKVAGPTFSLGGVLELTKTNGGGLFFTGWAATNYVHISHRRFPTAMHSNKYDPF